MIPQFFHSWTAPLFVTGLVVGVVGWVWFLFASYRADAHMARWSRFLPMLAIRLALEHRETCLKPFILLHLGGLLCLPQVLRMVSAMSVVEQRVFGY
ncbi:hypothetical protein DES53_105102 [Roseimicrobium gellanilyticum]|uniref:Uncharacterized protein n=1 Tax=Roseimicrobium gellanilyticum TaxID=748857 RepID=A0A366HL97_9BACT|nr:hypothetical protein [Roseimicrobium gellanilyticum]RBP43703.1 hypothetical protein DES53_105102 [Roseimicrobium gellanilyticum]